MPHLLFKSTALLMLLMTCASCATTAPITYYRDDGTPYATSTNCGGPLKCVAITYYRSDGTPYAPQGAGELPQPIAPASHGVSAWDIAKTMLFIPVGVAALGLYAVSAAHQNTRLYGPVRCRTYTYKDQYYASCY